jgi:hypothetical protein
MNNVEITLQRLMDMRNSDDYDEDFIKPNLVNHALADQCIRTMPPSAPAGWAATSGDGSLTVEWRNNGKHVALLVDERCRVYHDLGSKPQIIDVKHDTLQDVLTWLCSVPLDTTTTKNDNQSV